MQVPPKYYNLLGFNPTGDLGPLTAYFSQRGKIVWFPKAPPLNPPSPLQSQMRDAWRQIALLWRMLSPEQRADWETAAKRSRSYVTGFNLFIHWNRSKDYAWLRTIQRQAGITLEPASSSSA